MYSVVDSGIIEASASGKAVEDEEEEEEEDDGWKHAKVDEEDIAFRPVPSISFSSPIPVEALMLLSFATTVVCVVGIFSATSLTSLLSALSPHVLAL